jgi:hypothetical protein
MSALDLKARMLTSAWTAPTAGRSFCPGRIWTVVGGTSGTGGWTWPMPPPAIAPRD